MPTHGQFRALYVTDAVATMDKDYSTLVWEPADLERVSTTSIDVSDARREAELVTDTSDIDISYHGSRKMAATIGMAALTAGDETTEVGKQILHDAYLANTEIAALIVRGVQTVDATNEGAQYGYWFKCRVTQAPSTAGNDDVINGDYILSPSDSAKFEDVKP